MVIFWGWWRDSKRYKNHRLENVPWWLVGEQHKMDWVASCLASAAGMNHAVTISQLLYAPVDISALSFNGKPISHYAAETGSLDAIKVLLQSGASPHSKDYNGRNMLHVASTFHQLDVIQYLLKLGVDLHIRDRTGQTPLHLENCFNKRGPFILHAAACRGCTCIVKELVKQGVPVNAEGNGGFSPLLNAVSEGQCDAVEVLLELGADLHAVAPDGKGLLHVAVEHSKPGVACMLLKQYRVCPCERDEDGLTPLDIACSEGRANMVQVLLEGGAPVQPPDGAKIRTPLHFAARAGHAHCARILLKAKAKPNHNWNEARATPLILAASYGHASVLEALIPELTRRQIDAHDQGTCNTALSLAIIGVHYKSVRVLLEAGANPHKLAGVQARLPLTIAVQHTSAPKTASIVRALLQAGADPNAVSLGGIPVLHDACRAGGDGEIVKLLLDAGAILNMPCAGDGFLTPLHIAARSNHGAAVRTLVHTEGCMLNIQAAAASRATPLGMAVEHGSYEAVKALLDVGADTGAVPRNSRGESFAGNLVKLAFENGCAELAHLLALTQQIGNALAMFERGYS